MSTSRASLLIAAAAVVFLGVLLGGCRSYPSCKKDQHCENYDRGTPYCVDRVCRECIDDSACGFCERCDGNACVPIPGCCADDTDCTSPQICRDGRCGPQCLSDAECGDRERCLSGECIEAACRTDEHCPDGMRCENYPCVEPPDTTPCANRTFRTIYFDFDEHVLRADQANNAEWNLACFERFEGNVTLEGHCDERGTVEYNLALGDRRARTVRSWLETAGVDRDRMSKVSYGENRPVASGSNENAWRQNRRVETVWR